MAKFKQFKLPEQQGITPESIISEGGQTFLKQGEFQSPNFKTGEKGWKVNSEGEAEFQSVKIRLNKGAFGGDGSDGVLAIVSGTTTIDLGNAKTVTKNYTSISITGSGKLAFSNPHSTGSYIILKSQGNVTGTSSSDPNIDATGMGAAGGIGGDTPPENGTDGTTASPLLDSSAHFGAGGVSAPSAGGTQYGTPLFFTISGDRYRAFGKHLVCGSGGGGGRCSNVGVGGNGGRGGGSLVIECAGDLNWTGNIDVEGQAGADGTGNAGAGGGGGSGGTCLIFYNTQTAISGTISDAGGNGGASGPGGETTGAGAGGIGGAGANGTTNSGGGAGGGGAASGTPGGAASTSADHYVQI